MAATVTVLLAALVIIIRMFAVRDASEMYKSIQHEFTTGPGWEAGVVLKSLKGRAHENCRSTKRDAKHKGLAGKSGA
eukprot:3738055-Rhodomonas_salina.2